VTTPMPPRPGFVPRVTSNNRGGAATVSVVAGPAHADLHITAEAFDQLVWQLQTPLQELEVRQQVQQAILAAVQARRDAVVTFEKSSSTALLPRDRVDS
jgi:hypothetical protein